MKPDGRPYSGQRETGGAVKRLIQQATGCSPEEAVEAFEESGRSGRRDDSARLG